QLYADRAASDTMNGARHHPPALTMALPLALQPALGLLGDLHRLRHGLLKWRQNRQTPGPSTRTSGGQRPPDPQIKGSNSSDQMLSAGESAAQEDRRRLDDRGGVDAVVAIEGGARSRLAEVVHAQRELRHAERRADEREGVGVAVEHRHHR